MKPLKKIRLLIFLSVLLILGIVGFPRKSEVTPLFVKSEVVPTEISTLASQNWETYLTNMIYNENGTVSDYYLGNPFTIKYAQTIKYNFPIVKTADKKISYMFQIDSQDERS